MVKTLSELNSKALEDLAMLRANPNCPPDFDDEIAVFSGSRVSGLVPWQQEPTLDKIHELLMKEISDKGELVP